MFARIKMPRRPQRQMAWVTEAGQHTSLPQRALAQLYETPPRKWVNR